MHGMSAFPETVFGDASPLPILPLLIYSRGYNHPEDRMMGKISTRENKSVYQQTREKLGLSRAEAADLMEEMGVPEYRLVRLEDGSTAVQPEDVVAMARAYNEPELRNYYCTHQCPIGRLDAPEVVLKGNVHEILVNMVVALDSVNQKKGRLMEILADGEVEASERLDFEKISEELEKISMTVEALQLWCEKMRLTEE